jgi:hypothetical protein
LTAFRIVKCQDCSNAGDGKKDPLLQVGTSTIPLAGRGLFAATPICKGDYIGEYISETVEDEEYIERAFTDERMARVALSKCP